MEVTCEYCGEEIVGDPICEGDRNYCSHDCADAAVNSSYDYLDAAEFDNV